MPEALLPDTSLPLPRERWRIHRTPIRGSDLRRVSDRFLGQANSTWIRRFRPHVSEHKVRPSRRCRRNRLRLIHTIRRAEGSTSVTMVERRLASTVEDDPALTVSRRRCRMSGFQREFKLFVICLIVSCALPMARVPIAGPVYRSVFEPSWLHVSPLIETVGCSEMKSR